MRFLLVVYENTLRLEPEDLQRLRLMMKPLAEDLEALTDIQGRADVNQSEQLGAKATILQSE